MLCKAKVSVCSDIRTKHSTQNERHVEFLNVKPWWYIKKPLGFKRSKFQNSTWRSLCVECFVWISEQTATFALYINN